MSSQTTELLKHPVRAAIIERLTKRPGMNMNQLRRELEVVHGVLIFHLDRLIEEELVLKLDSAQDKEHLYFLPENRELWAEERTRILYGREAIRRVALFVAEHPLSDAQEIADGVERHPVTVRYHIKNLLDRALVAERSIARRTAYEPLKPLWDWTRRFADRYPVPWREQGEAVEVDGFGDWDVSGVEEVLLTHPSRQAIVETLEERPGMSKSQLRQELEMGPTVIVHHIDRLTEEGLVLELDSAQGKEHIYFLPEDEGLWENPRTRILYSRPPTPDIALFIAENPGCSSTEMVEALDVSASTVRRHLGTLIDQKIIVRGTAGVSVEYHPSSELMAWADEHGDRYLVSWRDGDVDG